MQDRFQDLLLEPLAPYIKRFPREHTFKITYKISTEKINTQSSPCLHHSVVFKTLPC